MNIKKLFAALLTSALAHAALAATLDVGKWSDLQTKINSASAGDTIRLTKNLSWGSRSSISISKSVTLDGQGRYTITRGSNYASYRFTCADGADVTLKDITIDGQSIGSQSAMFNLTGSDARLTFASGTTMKNVAFGVSNWSFFSSDTTTAPVTLCSGATFVLAEGSVITNCSNTTKNGGAVNSAGGIVLLSGGRIAGCSATSSYTSSGDAGAVYSSGTIVMSAGSITGCTASNNGGAVNNVGGTFTMTGGTITGCQTANAGGAIYSTGTATISGVSLKDCTVTKGNGGAVWSSGTCGLTDVTVSGCSASAFGGAVYTTGTLNLAGSLTLADNQGNGVINNVQPATASVLTQTGDITGSVGVTYAQEEGARFGTYASGTGTKVFFNDRNTDFVGKVSGTTLVWKDSTVARYPDEGKTLDEVLAEAAAGNGVVTITEDTGTALVIPVGYDITIDLDGHVLSGGITAKGRVTITDSSTEKNGEVAGALTADGGTFVIEYGAYAADPTAYLAANRIVVSNYDGTFTVTATADTTATELMSMDTREGQVRTVNDPATDLLPFTYSAGNFVEGASEDEKKLTGVYAIPVSTQGKATTWHNGTETVPKKQDSDGSFDYAAGSTFKETEKPVLLSEKPYEAEFNWQEVCYGLIKVVHSNANGKVEAFFKFAEPEIDVAQRSSVTNEYPIVINDAMLAALGYSRIGKMNKADVENHYNTRQPNGLRVWENLVTGANPTNAYVGDVNSVAAADANLTILMPGANPDAQYGYRVLYQLRKATNEWAAASDVVTSGDVTIPLTPSATGLYRLYTLIVPDSNAAITNEIATANTIGVLCVESSQTNTMVAVPWRALASDPSAAANISVSNYVRTVGLDDDDTLMALDPATDKYDTWTLFDGNWESGMTITDQGVKYAEDPDRRELVRGQGFWLAREKPLDENGKVRPFYLVGQFDASDVTTTIKGGTPAKPGYTMLGAPGINPVKINDINWGSNPLANDVISIPREGGKTPLALTWRNGAWGYTKSTYDAKLKMLVGTRVTDIEVPAGTAFWYARRGESFDFTWALTWPEAK